MKKALHRALSVVLALILMMSVCSGAFTSFAAEQEQSATPTWQTYLTDGKALKEYLEKNFLNLTAADKLLSGNFEDISKSLCSQLGELFYQMGYAEKDYPSDKESLTLCLARCITSLEPTLFRDPDRIETVDVSLLYNLAGMGGTEYIEKINAALPESLRFDTSKPVISLTQEKKDSLLQYYAQWKTGALRLDGFDFTEYLGGLSADEFLKDVLLIFIADDDRLPAILSDATGTECTSSMKYAFAGAVADIMDNLETAPVSAVLRQLSDSDFQSVLKLLLNVAARLTVNTGYYSYKLYSEGIYTDTDGSAVDYIKDNGDGTFSYEGPTLISDYSVLIDKVLDFLNGIYDELNTSALDCVFENRFDKLQQVCVAASGAVMSAVSQQSVKLTSDIKSAGIEINYAKAKIAEIDSGAAQSEKISQFNQQIEDLTAQIRQKQAQLEDTEDYITAQKDKISGYYDIMDGFNAQIAKLKSDSDTAKAAYDSAKSVYDDLCRTDKDDYSGDYEADKQAAYEKMTSAETAYNTALAAYTDGSAAIEQSSDYVTAKAKIDALDTALADKYSSRSLLKAEIKEASASVDNYETELAAVTSSYDAQAEKSVWQKLITSAQALITKDTKSLSELPSAEILGNAESTLSDLLNKFFGAWNGVYKQFLKNPVKAAVKLVYGLDDFVNGVENIDWNYYAPVTDDIFKSIDDSINSSIGTYLGDNGGKNILTDASAAIYNLMKSNGIYDYFNVSKLDNVVSETVLSDNSAVLQQAAAALKTMFPDIQPTYSSIISCIVPILSAFDFGSIMSSIGNEEALTASLKLASPMAFAYLAGISDAKLDSEYLSKINSGLTANGYTGDAVVPIITLTSAQKTELLKYVYMEKSGKSLSDIAAAGFDWTAFTGGTSTLDIANAFIKIDLGDSDKLGSVAEAPGVGTALIHLLCDLLNDVKTAPVTTVLDKVSDAADMSALADFAMGLLNGDDNTYKSYELFFTDKIYYDKDGNTTFYDKLDEGGNPSYTGPKAMQQYVPIIAAAVDLMSNISADVTLNGGDVLKTVLITKLPQLKNIIKSAITYKDSSGVSQPGLISYLLFDYTSYLKAQNSVLSYDVLIGIAEKGIEESQKTIEQSNAQIDIWNTYLSKVQPLSDAAKLAKAKALGILDSSVSTFDSDELNSAIESEKALTQEQLTAIQAKIEAKKTEITKLTSDKEALRTKSDDFNDWRDTLTTEGAFYDTLTQLLTDQDASLIETLRTDSKAEIDEKMGDGTFETLAALITENMGDYDGDSVDDFIDAFMLSDGINMYSFADELDTAASKAETAVTTAQAELTALNGEYTQKSDFLASLETGSALKQINAAGAAVTIHISDTAINAEGDFSADDIIQAVGTITNEDIAGAQANIAALEIQIKGYEDSQQTSRDELAKFSSSRIEALNSACDNIVNSLIAFIDGNADNSAENIYYYIMTGDILGIFTSGGRLGALHDVLSAAYETVIAELTARNIITQDIADVIISMKPTLGEFYKNTVEPFPTAFEADPVSSCVGFINSLYELLMKVYNGFGESMEIPADVAQFKIIADDVNNIFDSSFMSEWTDSYSKCAVMRTGETYKLIVDILGLSFIQDALKDDSTGNISGKLNTAGLYGNITLTLESGGTAIDSITLSSTDDGTFEFTDVPEGTYTLKVTAAGSVLIQVSDVPVSAGAVVDLTASSDENISNIKLPIGDVNSDGSINVGDISALLLSANYGQTVSDEESKIFDLNCDNSISVGDISIVLMAENYGMSASAFVYS